MILSTLSQAIYATIPADKRLNGSPIVLMKAVKNSVEAAGMRRAHIRDGAAVIKYFHWLNNTIDNERITELSGADKLSGFRR